VRLIIKEVDHQIIIIAQHQKIIQEHILQEVVVLIRDQVILLQEVVEVKVILLREVVVVLVVLQADHQVVGQEEGDNKKGAIAPFIPLQPL